MHGPFLTPADTFLRKRSYYLTWENVMENVDKLDQRLFFMAFTEFPCKLQQL